MIPLLLGWLGKSALMQSPVGGFLKAISPGAWRIIAIVAAVIGAFLWHQHVAHNALRAEHAAGYAEAMKKVEKAALELKRKVDAATTKIAEAERKQNAEEHRRIDRRADTLLVRGPGKAVCPVRSEPADASGRAAAGRQVDAQVDRVPDPGGVDLIALPFPGTVKFGRQNDSCEADLKSWWAWYDGLLAAWPKAGPEH